MQCIRLHWRRSVQGESRWLFFLCPTGSGQTESSGRYTFQPDPSGGAFSDGRDNAQTSAPCCHGQANHCFRPDKCARNHRGRMVRILWRELCPELSVRLHLINLPYPKFAIFKIGTSAQRIFNLGLRQNKSGGRFFALRLVDGFNLFGFGGNSHIEET